MGQLTVIKLRTFFCTNSFVIMLKHGRGEIKICIMPQTYSINKRPSGSEDFYAL